MSERDDWDDHREMLRERGERDGMLPEPNNGEAVVGLLDEAAAMRVELTALRRVAEAAREAHEGLRDLLYKSDQGYLSEARLERLVTAIAALPRKEGTPP